MATIGETGSTSTGRDPAGRGMTREPETGYADADREVRGLPANDRASGLVAGLTDGVPGTAGPDSPAASEWPPLRGDVLVTGLDTDGNDTDLPPAVLDQVTAAGLLPTGGHAGRISP